MFPSPIARLGEMYETIAADEDKEEAEPGSETGESPQTASTSDGGGGGEEEFVKVDLLSAQQPLTSESFPAFYEDIRRVFVLLLFFTPAPNAKDRT